LDQILDSARVRAGLAHATCHQLRHTCLTRLREAGMALEAPGKSTYVSNRPASLGLEGVVRASGGDARKRSNGLVPGDHGPHGERDAGRRRFLERPLLPQRGWLRGVLFRRRSGVGRQSGTDALIASDGESKIILSGHGGDPVALRQVR
jgi:hypothetical protein